MLIFTVFKFFFFFLGSKKPLFIFFLLDYFDAPVMILLKALSLLQRCEKSFVPLKFSLAFDWLPRFQLLWYRGNRTLGCQVSNSCLAWQRELSDLTEVKNFHRTASYSLVGGWCKMMLVLGDPGAHRVRIRRVLTHVFHLWDGRVGRKGQMRFAKSWIQSGAFRKGARHWSYSNFFQ